jgi:hypothetical protein
VHGIGAAEETATRSFGRVGAAAAANRIFQMRRARWRLRQRNTSRLVFPPALACTPLLRRRHFDRPVRRRSDDERNRAEVILNSFTVDLGGEDSSHVLRSIKGKARAERDTCLNAGHLATHVPRPPLLWPGNRISLPHIASRSLGY